MRRTRSFAGDEAFAVEEAGDDAPSGDVGGEQGECEADCERDRGLEQLEGEEWGEEDLGEQLREGGRRRF